MTLTPRYHSRLPCFLMSDLNGTLVLGNDAMNVYAFRQTAEHFWNKYAGLHPGHSVFEKFLNGFTAKDCAHKSYEYGLDKIRGQMARQAISLPGPEVDMLAEFKQKYDEVVCSKKQIIRAATVGFLQYVGAQGYPVAIGTNSSWDASQHAMSYLPLQIVFHINSDEVPLKPAPDMIIEAYHRGEKQLQIPKPTMVCMDDSVVGIEAAMKGAAHLHRTEHPHAVKIFGVPTKPETYREMLAMSARLAHVQIFKPEHLSPRPLQEELRRAFMRMAPVTA